MDFEPVSNRVIGCAIEVHRYLGPGLLESAYSSCLAHELLIQEISFEKEKALPVEYKGCRLDCGYRIDFLVENSLIVELKSVDRILPIHEAQLLSYLKLTGIRTGLMINFNEKLLKDGLVRRVL